jgi:hypothetical protein
VEHPVTTLNIEGHSVQVDDSFLKLSRDQQNATVDEIAKSLAPKPSITDAVTDIPNEIGKAASEAVDNLTALKDQAQNRAQQGQIEGFLNTGKAAAKTAIAVPQLIASPLTGVARSVGGHLLSEGERLVGENVVNPIVQYFGGTPQHPDAQQMYETAKGDVDTAMAGARALDIPPVAAPVLKPVAPTIEELKAAANAGYESPAVKNLAVTPTTISRFSQAAQTALNEAGFDENVAPKTFGILAKIEKVPDSQSTVVTGNNINSIRKIFGKAAGSVDPTEKAAASAVIDHLDQFIPQIPKEEVISGDVGAAADALETARGNYAAAKQAEKIDDKTIQAELRAAASHSGQNVANTVRQRMADVVLKPKESRGLTDDELAQAEKIVRGTPVENSIRTAGNLLGGGGGLGAAASAAIGGFATGGPGAIAPVVGYALKALSNRMTLNQAAKLSEMIRSRAPLASSVQKFEESAGSYDTARTAKAAAGAVLAARNLSNNLRGAGFNFSPSDLLRGLQAPPSSPEAQKGDRLRGG